MARGPLACKGIRAAAGSRRRIPKSRPGSGADRESYDPPMPVPAAPLLPGYRETPLWHEAVTRPLIDDAGPLPADADVVVVGGGYCGVTAAAELASRGRSVVLLEAGELGESGASTRNGGMVIPELKHGVRTLTRKYGATGRELARSVFDACALVGRLIEQEAIDCDFAQPGGLLLAHHVAQVESLREAEREWVEDLGAGARFVSRQELHTEIGSTESTEESVESDDAAGTVGKNGKRRFLTPGPEGNAMKLSREQIRDGLKTTLQGYCVRCDFIGWGGVDTKTKGGTGLPAFAILGGKRFDARTLEKALNARNLDKSFAVELPDNLADLDNLKGMLPGSGVKGQFTLPPNIGRLQNLPQNVRPNWGMSPDRLQGIPGFDIRR